MTVLEERVDKLEREMAALKSWLSWRPRELSSFVPEDSNGPCISDEACSNPDIARDAV